LRRRKTAAKIGSDLDRPSVNRGVIDQHPALGHHLLDVAQAQRVGRAPAHAHQPNVD
jgi:hypothetical protein